MEPIITKEDVREVYKRIIERLRAEPPKDASRYMLRTTSGTTAGALCVIYQIDPIAYRRYEGTRRSVILIATMNARLLNTLLVRYGEHSCKRVMSVDMKDIGAELAAILEDFAPDHIIGTASMDIYMASNMPPSVFANVKRVTATGELVTRSMQELIASYFPQAIVTQLYASSEITHISRPTCGYLPLNAYHISPGVGVAIHEPDENAIGNVLVSWEVFDGMRVSRYAQGDTGKFLAEPCTCGEKVTLQLMGRSGHDYLKLAGALLHKAEFDRVAALYKDYMDEYRVEAYAAQRGTQLRGGITLIVYRKRGVLSETERNVLADKFSAELFLTPTQTLADLVRKNLFMPLAVENRAEPFERKAKEVTLRMRP